MKKDFPEILLEARPQDYLLCGAVLLASVSWLVYPPAAGGAAPAAALLRRGGETLARMPLDRAASRTFALDAGRITVEVVPGRGVHISDSDCPAKLCMHHGWAGKTGETIACLPNKLLVEIEGEDNGYDAVIR